MNEDTISIKLTKKVFAGHWLPDEQGIEVYCGNGEGVLTFILDWETANELSSVLAVSVEQHDADQIEKLKGKING